MIKKNKSITEVKRAIETLIEKKVDVVVNLGRNKYQNFTGTLTGVYPALFTITPLEKDFKGKTTYSYSEYLCGKIRLKEVLGSSCKKAQKA